LIFFIQTICNGRSSRFVYDSYYIQSSYGSSILCSLSLWVIKIGRNSDYCILDFLADVGFSDLFHLCQDHWGNLFWMEFFYLPFVFDNYVWFSISSSLHFEWPVFHVWLNNWVGKFSADQSFRIENCVVRVLGVLVFGCITDQSFSFCKCDVRRCGSVSLIICNNLNSVILPDPDTGVSRSKINSNSLWSFAHLFWS